MKEDVSQLRVCPACGARQTLLTDVRQWQKYAREHPHTVYLRCEKCAQVQVVEE